MNVLFRVAKPPVKLTSFICHWEKLASARHSFRSQNSWRVELTGGEAMMANLELIDLINQVGLA